jgi:hypothetical protein
MDNIPCETCITFPICKELFRQNKGSHIHGIFIMKLSYKCSIIAKLTNLLNDKDPNREIIIKIIDFFYTKCIEDPHSKEKDQQWICEMAAKDVDH